MAGFEQLGVTAVTGALVVAVVGYVLTARDWRHHAPTAESRETDYSLEWAEGAVHSPTVWTLAFVASAGVAGLAAVGFVQEGAPMGEVSGLAMWSTFGVLLAAFLFAGTFSAVRGRGYGNAVAAMVGSWALGGALVLGVVVKLLLESP